MHNGDQGTPHTPWMPPQAPHPSHPRPLFTFYHLTPHHPNRVRQATTGPLLMLFLPVADGMVAPTKGTSAQNL